MSDFCSRSVLGLFSLPAFSYMLPLQLLPDGFSWLHFATGSCGSYSVSTHQMSWLPPASSLPFSEDEDMDCVLPLRVFTFCVLFPAPSGEGTMGMGHKVGLLGLVLASPHWGWYGRSEFSVVQAIAVTLSSLDEILGVQMCIHRCGWCPAESHDCSTCWSG